MNITISLKEAAQILHYKDTRSVERWCKKNNVEIFSEDGSNKKYLIRMQFEYVRLKKFIEYLKMKYKDKWLDAFKVYTDMKITNIVELEENTKVSFETVVTNYEPSGKQEIEFVKVLQNIKPEL